MSKLAQPLYFSANTTSVETCYEPLAHSSTPLFYYCGCKLLLLVSRYPLYGKPRSNLKVFQTLQTDRRRPLAPLLPAPLLDAPCTTGFLASWPLTPLHPCGHGLRTGNSSLRKGKLQSELFQHIQRIVQAYYRSSKIDGVILVENSDMTLMTRFNIWKSSMHSKKVISNIWLEKGQG